MPYELSQFDDKLVDANELKGGNLIDRDGRTLEDKLRKWENASPWVPCVVVRACSANPVIEGKRRWDEQRQANGVTRREEWKVREKEGRYRTRGQAWPARVRKTTLSWRWREGSRIGERKRKNNAVSLFPPWSTGRSDLLVVSRSKKKLIFFDLLDFCLQLVFVVNLL